MDNKLIINVFDHLCGYGLNRDTICTIFDHIGNISLTPEMEYRDIMIKSKFGIYKVKYDLIDHASRTIFGFTRTKYYCLICDTLTRGLCHIATKKHKNNTFKCIKNNIPDNIFDNPVTGIYKAAGRENNINRAHWRLGVQMNDINYMGDENEYYYQKSLFD